MSVEGRGLREKIIELEYKMKMTERNGRVHKCKGRRIECRVRRTEWNGWRIERKEMTNCKGRISYVETSIQCTWKTIVRKRRKNQCKGRKI